MGLKHNGYLECGILGSEGGRGESGTSVVKATCPSSCSRGGPSESWGTPHFHRPGSDVYAPALLL